MNDLSMTPQLLGQQTRALLEWWFDELYALVPAAVKAREKETFARLTLGRNVHLETRGEDGRYCTAFKSTDGILRSEDWSKIRSIAQQVGLQIVLDPDDVFCFQIRLPLQAKANLREAIQFQILQESPIDYRVVEHAYSVLKTDKSDASILVSVAIVKSKTFKDLRKRLADNSIATYKLVARDGDSTFQFNYDAQSPQSKQAKKRDRLLLSGICFAPIITALLALAFGHYVKANLQSEISALRADLGDRIGQTKRRLALDAAGMTLRDVATTASTVQILDALAVSLPKDSWVTELQITADVAEIKGKAANANAVAAALRENPIFTQVMLDTIKRDERGAALPTFGIAARLKTQRPK